MENIASAYGNNEQWHKAESWMQKALDLARTSPQREARRIAHLTIELSVIMVQTDREANAIPLLESTLHELNQPGCTHLVDIEISALAILAHATSLVKGPDAAEPVFRIALTRSEECYGKYSAQFANILGNNGNAWSEADEARAKEVLERALQIKEFIYGPAHPSTTSSRDVLAKVLNRMGLHKDCLALARKNLCYSEKYVGKNTRETLEIRSHLALTCENLYRMSGKKPLRRIAEHMYSECLVSMESIIGPEHPTTNQTRLWLASFLTNQQRYDESIPLRRMEL